MRRIDTYMYVYISTTPHPLLDPLQEEERAKHQRALYGPRCGLPRVGMPRSGCIPKGTAVT